MSDMETRDRLADLVEADSSLTPQEKETSISFDGDQDHLRVFSAKPTIVRSILRHAHFDALKLTCETSEGRQNVDIQESGVPDPDEVDAVYDVVARGPIGVLTIKGSVRSSNAPSAIVSTPSDVQSAREQFTDE